MARRPSPIKAAAVTRVLKAAAAAGHKARDMEIGPDGKITLHFDATEPVPNDDVELAAFRKKHGY